MDAAAQQIKQAHSPFGGAINGGNLATRATAENPLGQSEVNRQVDAIRVVIDGYEKTVAALAERLGSVLQTPVPSTGGVSAPSPRECMQSSLGERLQGIADDGIRTGRHLEDLIRRICV